MISGLVNFFVMLFYHGDFPARITWTLFFYTMGAVAIARIAIEQTRAYAHGYAAILGIAGFFVMSGYLGSVVFTAFILFMISYLADRIVHDCTLIDETLDASGQGLVDFGKELIHSHVNKPTDEQPSGENNQPSSDASDIVIAKKSKTRKTHQPGRTVMWLALAALPLFGLGQFMLRDDVATWERAKFLLAIYLFASLSLLVTTSFLGLRRYLRQRGADMPGNVSVGWLAGGLISILLILLVAYMAPVPGQLLASITLPDFLDSPKDKQASRYGWGNEGAQRQSQDDATTNQPEGQDDAPPSGESQSGAKPGEADHGNAKDAPAGSDPGGKKSGGEKSGGEKSGDSKSETSKSQQGGDQPSNEQNGSPADSSEDRQSPSDSPKNAKKDSNAKSDSEDPKNEPGDDSNESKNDDRPQNGENPEQSKERQDDPRSQQRENESQDKQQPKEPNSGQNSSSSNSSPQQSLESIGSSLPAISGILRWLIMLGLLAIVAFYVWTNYEAILQWWRSLFGRSSLETPEQDQEILNTMRESPPRSFSSFDNPVGRESDPRRAVVITFQAFEAWAREQGWRRNKDETPSEFLQRTSVAIPQAAEPARQIVDGYNRIVYGRGNATTADMRAVNLIWSVMTKPITSTS